VLTAASIERITKEGVAQIIHYDEGVGTGRLEKLSGGMFGVGLVANVREAYRFLIFNYDPGDEIFVFGFSRGAYSARTFVGFVQHVGPLSRLHAARIDEALDLYRRRLESATGSGDELHKFRAEYASGVCIDSADDQWRCKNIKGYKSGDAPPMRIRYLGVWDTVGGLGVPANLPLSGWMNRKHAFHNVVLTEFVESARHAVATDERRATFPVTPFNDLLGLNAARGSAMDAPDALYQEKWFPGVHGSVGGGGDIRGLSDGALEWVIKGARLAGLKLDTAHGTRIHGFHPNPLAPLINVSKPKFSLTQLMKKDRPGPDAVWQLSSFAVRRWKAPASKLPERATYRPGSLRRVAGLLDQLTLPGPVKGATLATHKVVAGENLSKLAKRYYDDPEQWPRIFDFNRDQLDDPDEIFVGQKLRIPQLS
jgi:uncharacterized protein (DUF2235 family)